VPETYQVTYLPGMAAPDSRRTWSRWGQRTMRTC